jgi:hypothetical protein
VLGGEKQSVQRPCRPGSIDILSLLGQTGECGSRQPLHPGQNGLELAILFRGGQIQWGGLRAELHVDGLTVDLVGPFEVRAMTLGPDRGGSRIADGRTSSFALRLYPSGDSPILGVLAGPGKSVRRLRQPGPAGVLCERA